MTTTAHCPACATAHKLSPKGTLPRHGFSAHHVRHGQSGGFHTGGCASGYLPIGTVQGDYEALQNAAQQEAQAGVLRGLAPITEEEARELIIAGYRTAQRKAGRECTKEQAIAACEARRSFASYNLKARIDGTQRQRLAEAQAREALAAELRRLVKSGGRG